MATELAGPQGLTEHANTFDERVVLQDFAPPRAQGAPSSKCVPRRERFAQREDVFQIRARRDDHAELVGCERRLIAAALDRAGERRWRSTRATRRGDRPRPTAR